MKYAQSKKIACNVPTNICVDIHIILISLCKQMNILTECIAYT
jgi:hypothetical protein